MIAPTAEQIARLATALSQSARIRFGEARAEVLRPTIQQGAEHLAIISSFAVEPEDELCLRTPLPEPGPHDTRRARGDAAPGTAR